MPKKGFLGSLFDLSFTSLITMRVIKVLYVISLVAFGLMAVPWVLPAFVIDGRLGVLTLFVGAPLLFLAYATTARVVLELVSAVFRIMETNAELLAIERSRTSA